MLWKTWLVKEEGITLRQQTETGKLLPENRESRNGYEIGVWPIYWADHTYSYCCCRYRIDSTNPYDSEIIKDFTGLRWPAIREWVEAYLAENPDDGIWNP